MAHLSDAEGLSAWPVGGTRHHAEFPLPDRPESERGQTPEVGFVFSNFAGVTAGSYSTLGEIYVVNGYQRGLESRFLELRSKPLAVTATVAP